MAFIHNGGVKALLKLSQIENQAIDSNNSSDANNGCSVGQSALKMLLLVSSDPTIHEVLTESRGNNSKTAASSIVQDGAVVPLLQLCHCKFEHEHPPAAANHDEGTDGSAADSSTAASTAISHNPQEADSDSDRTPQKIPGTRKSENSETGQAGLAESLLAHVQSLPSHLTGDRRAEPASASINIVDGHQNERCINVKYCTLRQQRQAVLGLANLAFDEASIPLMLREGACTRLMELSIASEL